MRTLYVHIPVYDHILGEKTGVSPFPLETDHLNDAYDIIYIGSGHPIAWGLESIQSLLVTYAHPFSECSIEINEYTSQDELSYLVMSGINRFVFGKIEDYDIDSMIAHLRTYPFVSIALDATINKTLKKRLVSLDFDHISIDAEGLTQGVYERLLVDLEHSLSTQGFKQDGYHLYSKVGHESLYMQSIHSNNNYDALNAESRHHSQHASSKDNPDNLFDELFFNLHSITGFDHRDRLDLEALVKDYEAFFDVTPTHLKLTKQGFLNFERVTEHCYQVIFSNRE